MIADLIMFGVVFQLFLHFEMYVASSEKIGTRILVVCLSAMTMY